MGETDFKEGEFWRMIGGLIILVLDLFKKSILEKLFKELRDLDFLISSFTFNLGAERFSSKTSIFEILLKI